jgi:hypothetical protein
MNDFNLPLKDLKINMKCLATNEHGIKQEINFIFPCIVKEETRHCYVCKADYEDVQHRLPSLKLHWEGCPNCQIRVKKMNTKFYVQDFLVEKQAEANKMRHETEEKEIKNKQKGYK